MSQPTAFVTGASVGIGRACAKSLSSAGYQLILLARRVEQLESLQAELSPTPCHLIAADVSDKNAIDQALANLPESFANIDVLVNNAGLALGLEPADKTDWADWQKMIDVNCTALSYLTWKLLPQMRERNQGHIINMGSIAGNHAYQGGNVYCASKAFVKHFSANLRADLIGTNIRVCNIEPGMLGGTEFSNVRFHGDDDKAAQVYENCQPLTAEDIGEAVRWVATQPAHVNVNHMEIMPVCQAPAGLAVVKD